MRKIAGIILFILGITVFLMDFLALLSLIFRTFNVREGAFAAGYFVGGLLVIGLIGLIGRFLLKRGLRLMKSPSEVVNVEKEIDSIGS